MVPSAYLIDNLALPDLIKTPWGVVEVMQPRTIQIPTLAPLPLQLRLAVLSKLNKSTSQMISLGVSLAKEDLRSMRFVN